MTIRLKPQPNGGPVARFVTWLLNKSPVVRSVAYRDLEKETRDEITDLKRTIDELCEDLRYLHGERNYLLNIRRNKVLKLYDSIYSDPGLDLSIEPDIIYPDKLRVSLSAYIEPKVNSLYVLGSIENSQNEYCEHLSNLFARDICDRFRGPIYSLLNEKLLDLSK